MINLVQHPRERVRHLHLLPRHRNGPRALQVFHEFRIPHPIRPAGIDLNAQHIDTAAFAIAQFHHLTRGTFGLQKFRGANIRAHLRPAPNHRAHQQQRAHRNGRTPVPHPAQPTRIIQ